ncbi:MULTISPECIES: FtsX-like permease family protein [unclassified Polaromonas]|jgi:putative ABC transport system permease protein|uniref:ABC transporter permease n=1 Tax=unclassified Polaromonas TaxID=2638319 RepID=UPI000BD296F3|nr:MULTISPECIES: FtsX-like permease family protein [unclassified Polaromonas]OYY36022.1 MAG: ABC transporter permease [Polaromonas sp. 35-63-35]OYZ19673.1 MAG: ABC transporter permease [Polaromonas sp. 16-63-31]OYZ80060.1 MAG: ABC transporter permease [Polaromonas sp. 24-63-21]OZA52177.1 MAG: ABC transporter permease [Polaromonas sp. 17-63-33]OZA87791.1 MAG: ABC transporter permease [Polaromonas sp. 39-63-25]
MNTLFLKLGWRTLLRDLRAGELRLLIVAVTLAVAALTAVGFFADRLKGGLQRDARQLLGGDAVLRSDGMTPEVFIAKARSLGLQVTSTVTFPTMGRAREEDGGASKLVAFKAVPEGYPLRGTLQVAASPETAGAATREIPAPGTAWADASLLDALGLRIGQTLLMGDARFTLTRVIVQEPDRGGGFANFSPRVMINSADLAATGLIQPASRTNYRFAVAGSDAAVKAYVQWATQEIKKAELRGVRIESLESGSPEMRQTLDRAEKFLNLVALLAALLSAVAVAIVARGFASKHLDDCAMLRVLGQPQRTIALAYTFEFVLAGMAASALGVLIGFAVHYGFVLLLAGLVETALPAPTVWPVAFGMGMGLTLLLAFGLPPVLQLAQVPPLRVIRRDVGNLRPASLAVLVVGVLGFAALLVAASSDLKLGLIAVGGFAGAVAVFAVASFAAVKLLRASVNEATAPRWLVLATRQLSARPVYAVVQVSALAVGLLALMLLVLLRTDLISSWRRATPPDAPNRFVINVQPEQGAAFQQALRDGGVTRFDWFPMIRGRLVAINGRDVTPEDFEDDRAKRLVDREFNLSHAALQPSHNQVVAGRWTPDEAGAISVEDGLASTLGLKLGDSLRFDIGGQTSEAKITSLRKVDWGSMRVNFFVMYPVAKMTDVPVSYISAFRAPERVPAQDGVKPRSFDNELVKAFPNITNVDMSSTIAQVQRVLDQVIRAVEYLFGFTLAAGLVVLFAAITATREERAHEFAIMRAVGARASLLRQVQRAELAGVGLLAGFLASIVALAVGWGLARYVFDFSWTGSWTVPLLGSLAGAVLAMAAGWWGLRSVLNTPVVETLRKAQ